ncbi:EAL domain-containing protein [Corallincola holothuriorum]|uniref:EAL domain-containing protein n=1 Tax=Corallincola holothuriorum TaxID=2282215 RepID=A0A368N3R4_9GAMM|nr:EAL domain-containing protein [Corallincola holothuriorum]RCU45172.1 EAL domain-containing protein [Corallincola holothuriorum]
MSATPLIKRLFLGPTFRGQVIRLLIATSLLGSVAYFAVQLNQTQQYLKAQLSTHAQDTAYYFGMWCRDYVAAGDLAMVETQVSSLVDSNYIVEFTLTDKAGKEVLKRVGSNQIEGVPSWFVNWYVLEPGVGTSELYAWEKLGAIEIKSNTGLAYEYLWKSAKKSLLVALLIAAVASLIGYALLFFIVRPLRAIEAQANAIAARDFSKISQLPGTEELRSVVVAMNRMAKAIEKNFKAVSERADKLQAEAYIDGLTQLGNRRAFLAHLKQLLNDPEQPSGALWFVHLTGLESLQQRAGAPIAKDQVKRVCELCRELAEHFEGMAFRTSESEIAMVVPRLHQLDQDANSLSTSLDALAHPEQTQGVAILGICEYRPGMELKQLLANADHALTLAGQPGEQRFHILAPEENLATDQLDISQRRAKMSRLITPPQLKLSCQPILAKDGQQVQMFELLSRFFDDQGAAMNTPDLFAELSRLGLIEQLDRAVIKEALEVARVHQGARLAINLSMQTILSTEFLAWLANQLPKARGLRKRITFELSEHSIQLHMKAAQSFIQTVRALGLKVTIEKFGVSTLPFSYLKQIRPDHIKVAGNYVHDINKDIENKDFITTLIQLGHGLDIAVFAEQVEDEEAANTLKELGIDGLQGYLFGQPYSVDEIGK